MSNTYVTTITADSIVEFGYNVYLINASSNNITMTLPIITCDGMNFTFRRTDSNPDNTVTLQPQGGQLIDGVSSKLLNPNTNTYINSYNNAWYTNGSTSTGNEMTIAFNQYRGNQSQPYVLVNNHAFTSLGIFRYNGKNYYGTNPIKWEIMYSINSDTNNNTDFTLQLQDITNTAIITTIGPIIQNGSSITFFTVSSNTFTNIPNSGSIIEIDGKIAVGSAHIRLHSVRLIFS